MIKSSYHRTLEMDEMLVPLYSKEVERLVIIRNEITNSIFKYFNPFTKSNLKKIDDRIDYLEVKISLGSLRMRHHKESSK